MEKNTPFCLDRTYATVPDTIFDLHAENAADKENHVEAIGGIIGDSKLSWLALGPYFQVFATKTAEVKSVWCFGAIVKEPNVKVTCISELKVAFNEVSLLVIGLKYGMHRGLVCVYNFSSTKVLRAIEIPEEVTSLHVISSGASSTTFPGVLSAFDGIISVGTVGGAVYLIDLCRELINDTRNTAQGICNELQPCSLQILTCRDVHNLEHLKSAASYDQDGPHLALLLNELETSSKHFELKTPQGRNLILAAKEEVTVSTLHYAPQLCCLFVGYNFGALQIFNFLSMSLEYTSPVYEEKIPVSYIAIQEAIDDPRAFCYFWAVYSCPGQYNDVFPLAVLYSLCYESKDYHDGYGFIYQNLQSCSVRFQANLQATDSAICKAPMGASCIRLQSYTKGINTNTTASSISGDEAYSLCMMAWNVRCNEHMYHTYLSIFDLNQWYKEQMPSEPYASQCSTYMSNRLVADTDCSKYVTLDVFIDPESIDPFIGSQKFEEHYRPSSLAYDLVTMSEADLSFSRHLGCQRTFFKELEDAGPLALIHPTNWYLQAKKLGLTPVCMELPPVESPCATHQLQCEALLSIALERRMLQYLCKCATSWGNGSHRSVGLSLEVLLSWGWERTRELKKNADRCCCCLFDYSGVKMDCNYQSLITECRIQFGTLRDLFAFVMKACGTFLLHQEIVQEQLVWLEKNYAYFNVIGWMINLRLLPENKQSYPLEKLKLYYSQRRNYLRSLDTFPYNKAPYLFIDQLTEIDSLRSEWKKNGTGDFPPDSLQTLLHCYFNNNLDIKMAHSIVAYTLLDLVMHMEGKNDNITTTMIKYPQIFDLSLSVTKVIQACWQLDHGQLEQAVNQLSNRQIHPHDIPYNQHKFIVNSLKLQKQYQFALLYLKSRNNHGNKEDVKMMIQLYVRNKMLFEALSIERRHNDNELLEAFFQECLNAGVMMDLLNFNLTRNEEIKLLEVLDASSYPKREEFKSIYFIRRGRFLDFYMRHDSQGGYKYSMPMLAKNTLDAILPRVTKKVIDTCLSVKSLNYSETKPLSAFACSRTERAKFQNDFMKACIVNCKDNWTWTSGKQTQTEDDFPFVRPPFTKTKYARKQVIYPKKVTEMVTPVVDHTVPEPPSKKMRLNLSSDSKVNDSHLNMTTIETLHVERNDVSRSRNQNVTMTPQSILKTSRNVVERGESTTPEFLEEDECVVMPHTPIVHFTGISSTNTSNNTTYTSPSIENPPVVEMEAKNQVAPPPQTSSTTTDYYSAETSLPEHDTTSRKRKLSVDDNQDLEEEPSVLRSTSVMSVSGFNSSLIPRFREVSELDSIWNDPSKKETEESTISTPLFSGHQDKSNTVFVFTGNEGVSYTKELSPHARPTYQTHQNRSNEAINIEESCTEIKEILSTKRTEITSKVSPAKSVELMDLGGNTPEKSLPAGEVTEELEETYEEIRSKYVTMRRTYRTSSSSVGPSGQCDMDCSSIEKKDSPLTQEKMSKCESIVDADPITPVGHVSKTDPSFCEVMVEVTDDSEPESKEETNEEQVCGKSVIDLTNESFRTKIFKRKSFIDYFELPASETETSQEAAHENAEVTVDLESDHHMSDDGDDADELHEENVIGNSSIVADVSESSEPCKKEPKNQTIIEISDSPRVRRSLLLRKSFIDYFDDPLPTAECSREVTTQLDETSKDNPADSSDDSCQLKLHITDDEIETSPGRSGESGEGEADAPNEAEIPEEDLSIHQRKTILINQTVIDLTDSPKVRRSILQRKSFIDYFDSPAPAKTSNELQQEAENSDLQHDLSSACVKPDVDVRKVSDVSSTNEIEESCIETKDVQLNTEETMIVDEKTTSEKSVVDSTELEDSVFEKAFIDSTTNENTRIGNDSKVLSKTSDLETGDASVSKQVQLIDASEITNARESVSDNSLLNVAIIDSQTAFSFNGEDSNDGHERDPVLNSCNAEEPSQEVNELLESTERPNDTLNTARLQIESRSNSSDEDNYKNSESNDSSSRITGVISIDSYSNIDTRSSFSEQNENPRMDESREVTIMEVSDDSKSSSDAVVIREVSVKLVTIPEEEVSTPRRRTRSSSMMSDSGSSISAGERRNLRPRVDSPLTIQLRSRRASSLTTEIESSTDGSKKSTSNKSKPRTRSSSVSEVSVVPAKRRSRAKSADALEEPVKVATPKRSTRKSILPAIEEEVKPIEENAQTTRRQKKLTDHVKSMDRLQLLDKSDFKGKVDADEAVYDSPARRTRRQSRSSVTPERAAPLTPKRLTRASSAEPTNLTPRRSSRRLSGLLAEEVEPTVNEATNTPSKGRPRRNSTK